MKNLEDWFSRNVKSMQRFHGMRVGPELLLDLLCPFTKRKLVYSEKD